MRIKLKNPSDYIIDHNTGLIVDPNLSVPDIYPNCRYNDEPLSLASALMAGIVLLIIFTVPLG
jgi:hypothetical protein